MFIQLSHQNIIYQFKFQKTLGKQLYLLLKWWGTRARGRTLRRGWVYLHWLFFFDFDVWCRRQRHVKGPRCSLLKERNEHSSIPWFPSGLIYIFPVKRWGTILLRSSILGQSTKLKVKEMWNPGFTHNSDQILNFSGFLFPNYKMKLFIAA